jgi:CYTH domain-containing protein
MDQTRGVTSLKYAHVERERRWLLGAVPGLPDDARRVRIVDRYLRRTRLRLREVTEIDGTVVRKLGHKVRLGDDAREVAHTSLYLDGAEWSVLAALPADVLAKTRTLVPYDGGTVAVDVLDDGLVLAEIDAGDGPDRELPTSYDVVCEVTDDERYSGAMLARSRPVPAS